MKTPNQISHLDYYANCSSIELNEWEELMEGTTKANGELIRKHIKNHLPDLYDALALEFRNPYEHQSKKKEGLFVYVHSGIEYFLTF